MTVRSFVLQAIVLAYSLTAGAFLSNPPSWRNEPAGLIRLAIAVAVGMVGMLVRNRYSSAEQRPPHWLVFDMVAIYGLIVLSQVALAYLKPEWRLPNWRPTQGGYVGFMIFAAARAMFASPWEDDAWSGYGYEIERERIARAKRRGIVYRVASAGAVALGGLGFTLSRGRVQIQIASIWIVVGSLPLLWDTFIGRTGRRARPADEILLRVLRSAARWYYLALLPASIIALFGSPVYPYWIPIVILMFAEANQRTAASCSRDCDSEARQRESAAT